MSFEIIIAAVCAGVVGGALAAFWLVRRMQKNTPSLQAPPAVTREARELIEQLDRLASALDKQVEVLLARTDQAARLADEKITQLQQLTQTTPTDQDVERLAATEGAGQPIWEPPAALNSPAEADLDTQEIVTLPGNWPLPPARPARSPAAPPPAAATLASPRHAEIVNLRRKGLPAVEIARKLQMDVGEIELVLNLNRSSQA